MSVFVLKRGDTRPILEVALKNPDGSAHDLTGSTDWKLHVKLGPATVFTRTLVKQGADAAGTLRYTWVTTDWDTGNLPTPPVSYPILELQMEYEVIAGGSARLTFPNHAYDTLQIRGDVA